MIAQTVRAHWSLLVLTSAGLVVVYYGAQIAVLYFRLGHLPNYITAYDYPANVARIIRSTPAVSDMIPIILNEWIFEIGYMDYDYGHGIAEWTMGIPPSKLLMIAIASVLISVNALLWRTARHSCFHLERRSLVGMTGLGAVTVGLVSISLSWVVCCGTPTWIVGLALLGLDVGLAFALEPFGVWIVSVGFIILAMSTLRFASHNLTVQSAVRRTGLLPEIA
ncbi:hypothetical protein [Nitrobacter winogradskyi]|uniref:hypothetical protein n=1 Tax=Nitrobacter winogradskyi TaxID=913 RepID=UPI0011D078DF|nr:hypothetical protein [Nitrobacter winogradskyi]